MGETVEQRRRHLGVPDYGMMPRLSIGWSLKFGFSLGTMGFSAKRFP